MQYQNRNALVTGASSGIGAAFARELASRGMNLLLTALPAERDRLDAMQSELRQKHGVRVEVIAVDLADPEGPKQLQTRADELPFEPDLLVNNAGIGGGGDFASAPLKREILMIRVNAEALVALCGLYLPRMVQRSNGAIINVASTSAFEPMPYMATYAASKAFVLRFSEALWAENHRTGVRIVAICPGPVATEFHQKSGETEASGVRKGVRQRYLSVESVVEAALHGLEQDKPTVVKRVSGLAVLYHAASAVGKLAPRKRQLLTAERLNRWYFRQK